MDKILKVGIIGCGSITKQRHAVEYGKNPNVEIVGFQDFKRERAEELVKIYGGKVYDSADDLIADENIDAVSICSANKFHASLTIAALGAGKDVLCEKPMAVTMEDCEAMYRAAKSSGKRLMIGQNQRLAPAHMKAKQLLDSGQMGRVITFSTTFGHRGPESWSVDQSSNTWFFKKDAASFGSTADLGIHKIDLMRYLIGCDVKSVISTMATLDKKFEDGTPIEVDDNSFQIMTFENGTTGTVTTSWTHYGEECNATVLYCENGIIKLYSDPVYSVEIQNADGTKVLYQIDRMQTNEDVEQTSSGVIDTFVDGVLNDKKTVLDVDEVIGSMRAVFAGVESSEKKKMVEL